MIDLSLAVSRRIRVADREESGRSIRLLLAWRGGMDQRVRARAGVY